MGCHGGVKVQADLVLTSGNSYGDLVNVATDQCNGTKKRVVPGDPAASYLINKLTATAMCTGTQMPKKGAISPAEVDIIGAWICGGAKND
jgi:hypothetical protein